MKVPGRYWKVLAVVLISFLIYNKYGCGKNPFGNDTETYRWYELESPTEENLCSVYFVNSNDGWAVGDRGTIVHYDGSSWQLVDCPVRFDLWDVYFISSNSGWAIGNSDSILHYNGDVWEVVYSDTLNPYWSSIFFTSNTSGWVCWSKRWYDPQTKKWESFGTIMHYDGENWTTQYRGKYGGISLWFLTDDEGWCLGNGMLHYNNGSWTVVDTIINVSKVHFLSPTYAWGIAHNGAKSGPGTAQTWHYDGTGWEQVENPAPADSWGLSDIYFVDENNGWAVGGRGSEDEERPRGYIMYYNGTSWTLAESSIGDCLESVYFLSRDEGWAVGMNGTILHCCRD